jgi:hypothetical protein
VSNLKKNPKTKTMKKTMLTLALVGLSAAATFAQGTIQFLNSGLSPVKFEAVPGSVAVNAPQNIGIVIGVWWGTSAASLQLQTPTAKIGTGPTPADGVFNGGAVYSLPGAPVGSTVSLKISGWVNINGTTPDVITGRADPRITHYGESAVVTTLALAPESGPGTVVWQGATGVNPNRAKPFVIAVVPEPSVMALGALGLGALLLRRRKA